MEQGEHILNILAAIAGIIAFVWIGARSEVERFKKAVDRISKAPGSVLAYLSFLLVAAPYLIFCAVAIDLVWQAREITVKHHIIKMVQAGDQSAGIEPVVELASRDDHFEVRISGAVFGPELRSIRARYGKMPVRVFAVVSEQSAPTKQGLVWVQGNEFGTLNQFGDYMVRAYLGGAGIDSAKDGDVFLVRIYIPKKQDMDFSEASVYESFDALPRALFLSEPIYIRCRRPLQANHKDAAKSPK